MADSTHQAKLDDRGLIHLAGPDVRKLLQGLITNDVEGLAPNRGVFSGLLSPQGKILFDFLLHQTGDGVVLDIDQTQIEACIKRLTLYRLRSDVSITDMSDQTHVIAAWGEEEPPPAPCGGLTIKDPRHDDLGWRIYTQTNKQSVDPGSQADAAAYHRHRISLGVPEGGKDYVYGGAFPHEALYDEINGVSFSKGCFVGQEVVSRMEHRGATRKRIVMVTGQDDLPPSGADIKAGDIALGTLGSSSGRSGLALIRIDRLQDVRDKKLEAKAGGVTLTFSKQPWAKFELA